MKKSIFLFFAAILCSMSIDAYAATQRYIYVGLSNNYHKWKDANQWGINHWGGTGEGVVPGSKITDLKTTITHSNCTFHMYRMYVYDDNKNFEFKGSDSWWDCKKEGISISGTTKNALLFRDNDGGDGGSPTFYQTNYQEESAVSLSASSNSVSVGEEVTLTPKLTSNAEYNEIASTTYSVGTGATVSDGKFVATTAGTYTVTATITYNPKKFTGITKKVENVTCEIVVSEMAVPHPVTGVIVAPTSVTIKQGATTTLTATVAPSNADNPSVTWSSDNNSVATVVNGVVTAVAAGTANITVTTVDGGFTATCAVKVKPLQYTFYAINSAKWPTVAAHYWEGADGGSAWPGANMVKESETINGFDIYSITISSDFVNIMFTNQINGDNNKKTADLTTEGNNGKYYDIKEAKWYASLSEVPVTYDYYVIGTVNEWGLKDANFGMTDDNADGVYEKVVTLADGKNQMKINNGTWDNASTFGYDQLDAKYEGVSRGKDEDDNNIIIDITTGKDITIKFDKNANKITLDGLTKIEDYYTVVGVAELFGTAWDRANETNKMAKQDNGSYKLVKENVTLAAIGYDWKIAKNGDWWNDAATGVNPSGGGNNTLTITTAGRYNVTFTLAADFKSAKVETELLEAAVVIPDCFISGNKNLTGKETEWQGNEFTMVYDEATETWSYTLAGLQPEKAYELKVVCGGTWYNYTNLASVPTGVIEGNDHSIAFKMAAAGDVVVTYNVEDGITLSGNFALPVTYDYYIAGTLAGGWSATQQGMEKDGELYKATFTELNAGTYQFKITDGQFNSEGDNTHEHTTLAAEYKEVSYVDGNIQIITEEAINLTVIFDATASKITFEGLTEIVPKYYLVGTFNAWNPADLNYEMTLDGGVYKKEVTLAKDDQFKVCNGSWDASWGKNNLGGIQYNELTEQDDNIKMKEAKTFTVIFNPAENLILFEGLTEKVTYVLMGVNGDWETGIELVPNPKKAGEYMLLAQTIAKATDAVKIVKIEGGNKTQYCQFEDVKDGSVACTEGTHKNIVLEDGIYNFYYTINDNKVYIEVSTPALTRTIPVGYYATVCLTKNIIKVVGATLFEVAGKDGNRVIFDEVITPVAGMPYIFLTEENQISFYCGIETAATPGNHKSLHGTFEDMADAELDGMYMIQNNRIVKCAATGCSIPANRAYFNGTELDDLGSAPALMPGRRRIAMGAESENEATGTEDIITPSVQFTKKIVEGQLIIIRDGVKYNAQGQKL